MVKLRCEFISENGAYLYSMVRVTVSVNENLTWQTQGPFDRNLRMMATKDGRILAMAMKGKAVFDPESGRPLSFERGHWVRVGRVIEFKRGTVLFLGSDEQKCLWEVDECDKF